MDNSKTKMSLDALWTKYQKTLEMLDDALEKLAQKPKEVERIVEVERVVEVPVTEWVEVPVDKVVDISDQERKKYETRIKELEQQLENLNYIKKPKKDYWGQSKQHKRKIDDLTYDQQVKQRYQRLLKEVKSGTININSLTPAEQVIINGLMNE